MIKKGLILLFILAVVVFVFKFGIFSQTPMLYVSNAIKTTFISAKEGMSSAINTHFDQAETIERLGKENEELKLKVSVLNGFASEVIELGKFKKYEKGYEPLISSVRVISYAQLPYFQKVWVDFEDYNNSKIYGLLYNGSSAGIISDGEKGSALALLNGDPKCSYAVYVGKEKAPGIIMGKNDREMIVKYIPSWMSIETGDEVMTSGLDEIFIAGIKVGVVTDVKTVHAYKEATVKPYFNSLNPRYFYVIEKTR